MAAFDPKLPLRRFSFDPLRTLLTVA